MTFSRRVVPVLAVGATLLFSAACNSSGDDSGAPAASAPAASVPAAGSSAAGNTAAICKSGGEAARTVVLNLFTKMAELLKGDSSDAEAELDKLYRTTFSALRDDLKAQSGKATDPELAAVLTGIATEADKIATAADPEAAGTDGFEAALGKLEKFCPDSTAGASAEPGAAPAAAGTVGGKGSACDLPVTFAVPEKWKLSEVDTGGDDNPLAELTRRGSLRMACEANARTAGLTGFLRVWVGPRSTGDARAALQTLQKGQKTRDVAYTPIKLGGQDGVELTYQLWSELLEEYSERRAFAVVTPGGAVVVELSGLEQADPVLQAAYDQAKSTLQVNS